MNDSTRAAIRPPDELANLITHGVGFCLSLLATGHLLFAIASHESDEVYFACVVYVFSLTGLYAASTLSHSFHDLKLREFFRTLDQIFIFILIAGSYTPFAVIYCDLPWVTFFLWVEWGIATFGLLLCLRLRNLPAPLKLLYGIQGWLPSLLLREIIAVGPNGLFGWVVAGGLSYTLGTMFLINDKRRKYFHSLWHLSVIIGSACHYRAIVMVLESTPSMV